MVVNMPTFFNISVTAQLNNAVQTGMFPVADTVIQIHCPLPND
jgi:hypothetical protein